ncbi:unnamed protein product [Linum trigynum]|uniref:Uncharacterized protein n=1 Tax=Linum trigynum TaxID=586398 RepID=A0AAV2EVM7_9ROSI
MNGAPKFPLKPQICNQNPNSQKQSNQNQIQPPRDPKLDSISPKLHFPPPPCSTEFSHPVPDIHSSPTGCSASLPPSSSRTLPHRHAQDGYCACSGPSSSSTNPFNNRQWKRDWGRWLRERRILRVAMDLGPSTERSPPVHSSSQLGTPSYSGGSRTEGVR